MGMLSDVLRINERTAEAYLIKGMAYETLENTTLAASSYQTAIEVDPDYYDAYIHRGILADRLGEKEALDYYNSGVIIRTKRAWKLIEIRLCICILQVNI